MTDGQVLYLNKFTKSSEKEEKLFGTMNDSRPAWWEAVNSEFVYEQRQVRNMKSGGQSTHHGYEPNQMVYEDFPCMNQSAALGYPSQPYSPSNEYSGYPEMSTYPPCQGPRPWNFAYCYGYYGEPACPLINMVDMEDFM